MNRFANAIVALCFAAGLTACGGGYSGFILPVESELNPWVAPATDEILPGEDATETSGDDGDYEDYEDEEDGGATAPAVAPPAPAKK